MTELTRDQRNAAHGLAQRGYGVDDIRVRLGLDAELRGEIRDIVLGKSRRQSTPLDKLFRDARGRPLTIRQRQAFATSGGRGRSVPITLPTISILGEDQ